MAGGSQRRFLYACAADTTHVDTQGTWTTDPNVAPIAAVVRVDVSRRHFYCQRKGPIFNVKRRAAQEGRSVGLPRPAVGGSGYPGMGRSVGLPRRDGRSEGGASPTPRCRHCRNGCPFAIVQCRHRLRTRHARRLVLTFHRLGVADRLTRANSAQYA